MKYFSSLILFFLSVSLFSQIEKPAFVEDMKYNKNSVTFIINKNEVSQDAIYFGIRRWVAMRYLFSKDKVLLEDKELGVITIKGHSDIPFNNPHKELFNEKQALALITNIKSMYVVEIQIKKGKMKIQFNLLNLETSNSLDISEAQFLIKGFNFKDLVDQNLVDQYNDRIVRSWMFVGKRKTDRAKSLTPSLFNNFNNAVFDSIIADLASLNRFIEYSLKEDW